MGKAQSPEAILHIVDILDSVGAITNLLESCGTSGRDDMCPNEMWNLQQMSVHSKSTLPEPRGQTNDAAIITNHINMISRP
jgi:hypothetical protein